MKKKFIFIIICLLTLFIMPNVNAASSGGFSFMVNNQGYTAKTNIEGLTIKEDCSGGHCSRYDITLDNVKLESFTADCASSGCDAKFYVHLKGKNEITNYNNDNKRIFAIPNAIYDGDGSLFVRGSSEFSFNVNSTVPNVEVSVPSKEEINDAVEEIKEQASDIINNTKCVDVNSTVKNIKYIISNIISWTISGILLIALIVVIVVNKNKSKKKTSED